MRNIVIVYNNEDKQIAKRIESSLRNKEYAVEMTELDDNNTIEMAYSSWKYVHLVITINLAGFSFRNSGNNSVYSTLDMDTIHYIDKIVNDEAKLLDGLITINMRFVTDSKDQSDRLLAEYRRIHDVMTVTNLGEEILRIVDNMDWRKEAVEIR